MKDPQTAGPPLPDPSERPEVPENLHSARQPLTNDWHKHPASFTPTAIALKCNPWSVPLRLSQTPLHGTDACLRSPSCLIPLPSGSHVPFQIVACLFFPPLERLHNNALLNSTVSIFSSGEIDPRQPALWPVWMLFNLSNQFLYILLCILATSSSSLLLLLGPCCFFSSLCPFLHEMFPWYLQFWEQEQKGATEDEMMDGITDSMS